MNILIASLTLITGIVLVAKGGDSFVDAASWIAKTLGIPSFIIGATIVSIATTLPEMIVSVMAAAQGSTDMAIGNAIGSVTANTGLILGIAFVFMQIYIVKSEYLLQGLLLILCSAVIFLGSMNGYLSSWAIFILIPAFIIFTVKNLIDGKKNMDHSDDTKQPYTIKQFSYQVLIFIAGAIAIVVGSRFLINSGTDLAIYLGVPERIIAVTFVAVGTSVPELVTTLTAIRKKEHALSIGNIIGANIIDLSLILPICSLVSGQNLPVSTSSAMIDLPACLIITLIGILPLLHYEKAGKLQGLFMLASYAIYLFIVV